MKFTVTMRRLLRNHILAICIAFAVAILVVSPHVRSWLVIGPENFEGVYPAFNDDEIYYQARIKEAAEGNYSVGNPYLKEHVNDAFIQPPVVEWLLGTIVRLTDVSVPFLTSASDAVLAFVDFLLIYALFLLITHRGKLVSLLYTFSFFMVFLSTFGRPVSPQFNLIFLLIGLIVVTTIYMGVEKPKPSQHLLAGLITGVTFFISPYYFTTLFVLYFLLMFARSFIEKSVVSFVRSGSMFFATLLPFAFIYVYFQHRAGEGLFYAEVVQRFGLMHTHLPGSFTNVGLSILTLCVLILSWRLVKVREFFYGAALLVGSIGLNWQNIITGQSLQFSSHYLFTTVLSIFMVLAIIHCSIRVVPQDVWSRIQKYAVVGSVAVLFLVVMYLQKEEFLNTLFQTHDARTYAAKQDMHEVFDWLRKNTAPESVVYSLGGDYDFFIPVYTENKVYYNFYATLFTVGNAETEERWLVQNIFDQTISTSSIRERQRDFWGNRYIDTYQSGENRKKILAKLTGGEYVSGVMVPDEMVEYMYSRWKGVMALPLETALRTYEIDYILISPEYEHYKEARASLEGMGAVSFVADLHGVRIYAFK